VPPSAHAKHASDAEWVCAVAISDRRERALRSSGQPDGGRGGLSKLRQQSACLTSEREL
jgi:hypothetical protein